MQSLTSVDLSAITFYNTFRVADFAGIEHVMISATGYTEVAALKFTARIVKWNKCGIKYLKLGLPMASNP